MSANTRCLCLLVFFYLKGVFTSTCGFTNFVERWYKKENEIANISYILDITDGPDVSVSLNILFQVCENNYLQTRCNCILSKPSNKPVSVVNCMGTKQVCFFTNQSLGSVEIQISYPLSLPLSVMRLSWRSQSFAYETARMIRLHVSSNPPTSFRPVDVKGQTPESAKREGDVTYSVNSKGNGPSTGCEENGLEQKTSASFDVLRNVNMSCITRHQATHQLQCTFPASLDIVSAIAVYFTPDTGSERRVVNCVQLEDLECTYESGFKCETLTSKYAEITVPASFQQISGTFRCQTPGFSTADIRSCHWPPAVTQIPDDISQTAATFSTSQHLENFTKQDENEDNTIAVIVSVAVVLASLLLIALVVSMALHRKRMEDFKKRTFEKLNSLKRLTSSSHTRSSSTDSDSSERTPRRRDLGKKMNSSNAPSLVPQADKGT